WFAKNASTVGQKYAHRIGQKKPTPWGLYDIHGNVWEWCRDWQTGKPRGGTDPISSDGGSERVHRGGCWNSAAAHCASGNRDADAPDFRDDDLGFRLALEP